MYFPIPPRIAVFFLNHHNVASVEFFTIFVGERIVECWFCCHWTFNLIRFFFYCNIFLHVTQIRMRIGVGRHVTQYDTCCNATRCSNVTQCIIKTIDTKKNPTLFREWGLCDSYPISWRVRVLACQAGVLLCGDHRSPASPQRILCELPPIPSASGMCGRRGRSCLCQFPHPKSNTP